MFLGCCSTCVTDEYVELFVTRREEHDAFAEGRVDAKTLYPV